MRQLKRLGMNDQGLKLFYCANIRSVLSYASPVFYTQLSDTNKAKLEKVQDTATKIILPDLDCTERLSLLNLCSLGSFIHTLSENHFLKISGDENHPLFSSVIFNQEKRSSRLHTKFRPPRCRTQKRNNSFFPFDLRRFNNLS